MTGTVGQPERATQDRVIALFRDELRYRYLGDWTDRDGNSNIEEALLSAWLTRSGCTPAQISVALHKLRTEADSHSRTLYGNNQAVYNLLRYGVPVKIEAGKVTETAHLINWHEPEKNDFAIAEEVTLRGRWCGDRYSPNCLGVSVRTLQEWEQGRRAPSGAARTLLLIAAKNPRAL